VLDRPSNPAAGTLDAGSIHIQRTTDILTGVNAPPVADADHFPAGGR
jgi:hypothetical protein